MMRAAVPLAILLAGCDGAAPSGNAAAPATPDPVVAAIAALPAKQRDATLFRAIRDARQPCQQVVASRRIEDVQAKPAWVAGCEDGARYVVAFGAGGVATVIGAAEPAR